MSAPAVLIANAKLRPGEDQAFAVWQARHNTVIGKFPGFISSDIIPPLKPESNEWTIILNFRSQDELTAWQRSSERAKIIGEALPLFEGGSLDEVAQPDRPGEQPGSNVTEMILSKIKLGMDDTYREWAVRIQAAQAKYAGYRGMYLQPPAEKDGFWTTIIRYDTTEHLEAWMEAPERAELLKESQAFIDHEQLMRLATSFPGWVPINPVTGTGPPNWKTALLVILGLFPVVMIEMRFLSPILASLGLHASLATFISNGISVAVTTFVTMPLTIRWFGWWLFTEKKTPGWVTPAGLGLLGAIFAIEVGALWDLLPW
ncbi:MAG TPA: antibiotic biosynthesis monooxygenase [Candidatus Acidoferrales bacterium]|jgi:antibiotic biosynthesis monooxygenase (ABM) superfamily enzyme|nr:antibiotic biosynthesis monooxygenase [Candidatus Acidoferrales bacterium]